MTQVHLIYDVGVSFFGEYPFLRLLSRESQSKTILGVPETKTRLLGSQTTSWGSNPHEKDGKEPI